jgi:16S rRNA (cytosine967-C5)-methyltransferase
LKLNNDPRLLAFEVLTRVEEGAFSDLALDAILSRRPDMDRRDRGLVTELIYGVLRCRGRLDFALSTFCKQPLEKIEIPVLQILRIGAYQLLHLDRIPDRAAVHETVEMAHELKLSRASGFINGVLRALIRGKETLVWPDPRKQPRESLIHSYSLPPWLAEALQVQLGDAEAQALAEALLVQAPFTLRANTLKDERRTLMDALTAHGDEVEATSFAPEGLAVVGNVGKDSLAGGIRDGLFMVQDEASMLIAHLLAPQKGERLLDVCAAPGGKTTHLAALAGNEAKILALDLHEKRLRLVREGAAKLGCRGIETKAWDLLQRPDFLAAGSFDRVLVDAPCSGLGVMRRNPEVRWRRKPSDLEKMAVIQNTILENVAPLVREGGVLLYSVCTFTPEETFGVMEEFLNRHPDFVQTDLRPLCPPAWETLFDGSGNFRTWPHRHMKMDAFFAVRFQRRHRRSVPT